MFCLYFILKRNSVVAFNSQYAYFVKLSGMTRHQSIHSSYFVLERLHACVYVGVDELDYIVSVSHVRGFFPLSASF